MSEERWISTLKTVHIILAVIAVVLIITHTDEIGAWIAREPDERDAFESEADSGVGGTA